jgi:hypothetical protein
MNRLKDFFDSTPEPEGEDNYFIIESLYDTFAVSRETADDVARQLGRHPAPRWVTFRDLGTAFHRVLAGHVYRLSESTAQQRAASRAFWRARKLEAKADRRPWEDDD